MSPESVGTHAAQRLLAEIDLDGVAGDPGHRRLGWRGPEERWSSRYRSTV